VKPKPGRFKKRSPWLRHADEPEREPRPVPAPIEPPLGPAPGTAHAAPVAPVWTLEDGRFVLDLTGPSPALYAARHAAERAIIYTALARGNGVQAEAARLLGASRQNMSERLRQFRDEDRS
jgi:DNA-binding NtrC family response regulator